jgi:hypothetical protein
MELVKLTESELADLTGVNPAKDQEKSGTIEVNGTAAV